MKKQQIYLPNLESLFTQHLQHLHHQRRLKNTKSQYELPRQLTMHSKEIDQKHREVSQMACTNQESLGKKLRANVRIRYKSSIGSYQEVRKEKKSPFDKKKYELRCQQNCRMYIALQNSIPVVSTGTSKELADIEAIKQRISKFSHEGNSVKYKFKKSLVEIMKRKQQQHTVPTTLNVSRVEEVRKKLEELNAKRVSTQMKEPKDQDIFLHSSVKWHKEKSQEEIDHSGIQQSSLIKKKLQQTHVGTSPFLEKKERASSPEKCITEPCKADFLLNSRYFSNKRSAYHQWVATQIKHLNKKMNKKPSQSPTAEAFPRSRKTLLDMQIVCLPQLDEKCVFLSGHQQ